MSRATQVASMVLLGTAFLLAGSAAARDGVRSMVHEMLKVESRDGKVLVRMTIDNQSDHTVYVPRSVASEKEPFGNLFEVRDSSNGDPVNYIGPMVKRGPLGKEDFLPVKPHTRHHNTIDITSAYAFMPGRRAYQLNYSGHYLTDLKKTGQTTPVEPDSVMFAHVGKP